MKLPVAWMAEAVAELKQARAWYDNVRPALGERYALAVDATVEGLQIGRCGFPSCIADGGGLAFDGFRMESSLKFRRSESW